jgi:DinB superfamily
MPGAVAHDWTMTACAKCHFVYEDLPAAEAPGTLRRSAREIRERLGTLLDEPGGVERLRTRPEPETWSALEYAGHVRDVLLTQHGRIYRALIEDVPAFAPMHRDERAVLGVYNDEDPATTATEVAIAADLLSRLLARLDDAQWSRRCIYNYPEPTEVDVAWVARHSVHELVHHILDIDSVIAQVA